jgi:hypothetical protein
VAENPADAWRPTAYTPVQCRFSDGEAFKHADMKWQDYEELSSVPVEDSIRAPSSRENGYQS